MSQLSISVTDLRDSLDEELLEVAPILTVSRYDQLVAWYAERTPHFSLMTLVRQCDSHPADVLQDYGSRLLAVDVTRSTAEQGLAVVRLRGQKGIECVVVVQPAPMPGIWLLSTAAKSSSPAFSSCLDPLLQRLSPLVVGGWVPTKRLVQLLEDMEEHTDSRIRPSRVASRARSRSTVDWLNASTLRSVAKELSGRGAYLQSLAFSLVTKRESRTVVKGSVGRNYRVSYQSGSLAVVRKYLVEPLALLLADQAGIATLAPETCEIGEELQYLFDAEELGDRESHERFLSVVGELPRLSVSSAHMNPYMLLSVVDYEDGSLLDIFSSDPTHVVFKPGPRCSAASVLRIASHVYSSFAAGRLAKAQVQDLSEMGFGED